MSAKAEAALRRLVTSLAKKSEEDIEDVLNRLDPAERRALAPLLGRQAAAAPVPEPPAPPPPRNEESKPEVALPAGVSPWLARRIGGVGAKSADGSSVRMTPLAYETLRAVAAETPNEPDEPPAPSRWRLFKRRRDADHADERS